MNIAIWGSGISSHKIRDIFNNKLDDKIACFIDNNYAKLDLNADIPVISIHRFKSMYDEKQIDYIIIPGYEFRTTRSIFWQLQDMGVCILAKVYYCKPEYLEKMSNQFNSFKDIILDMNNIIPLLASVEYEVSESCNLKCNRCNHYSNLQPANKFADLTSFTNDLLELKKYVYDIDELKLLGGEPLLNPNLSQFLYKAKEIYPNSKLIIISNGILIMQMSAELIKAIKETGTTIDITLYPPMKKKIDDIINHLKSNHLPYSLYNYGDEFFSFINKDGDSNVWSAMRSCFASICHSFKNGRVYKCASSINIQYLNQKFNVAYPDTSISLYDKLTASKLLKYLVEPCELCRYCGKFEAHAWTAEVPKLEDWYSNTKAK